MSGIAGEGGVGGDFGLKTRKPDRGDEGLAGLGSTMLVVEPTLLAVIGTPVFSAATKPVSLSHAGSQTRHVQFFLFIFASNCIVAVICRWYSTPEW